MLGSKVALSLGVESFRVITIYNGKRFKFDVFLDKVESIISKFDSKGNLNEPFILVDEKSVVEEDSSITKIPAYIAYCESTTEKNGVEIQVEVKKHNKDLFFDAVKSQLMYMPNIKFLYKELNRTTYEEVDIAAEILYRDENVIISKSTVYDKPHILLGTGDALINYGYVSFKDLEIEPKRGSVGLIMDINDIEVTPSRESPIWSAKTRAAVLEKYKMVTKMASRYLNKELSSETDYLKWCLKASQIIGSIRSGGNNTSVLSRLASIIDLSDIENVTYPLDSSIVFDLTPKNMFGNSLTVRIVQYNSSQKKVIRESVKFIGSLAYPVYFTKIGSNPYKDRYLYDEKGEFVLINIKENAILDKLGTLVVNSSLLLDYDNIVVPEDRMDLYTSDDLIEDDSDTTTMSAPKIDYAANRKINKQIVVHYLSGEGTTYNYKFSAIDTYITELFGRPDYLTVYSTSGDREALSNLLAIFPKCLLTIKGSYFFDSFKTVCDNFKFPLPIDKRITGVLIAQENLKYIENSSKYISMKDFVIKSYDSKNEKVVFSDLIKFAATSSAINQICFEKFRDIRYFNNNSTKLLSEDLRNLSCFYKDCKDDYSNRPPIDLMTSSGFLHDAILFQLYKTKLIEASDETIDALQKNLNSNIPDYLCDFVDIISDVDILDINVFQRANKIIDYYYKFDKLIKTYVNSYECEETCGMLSEFFKFKNGELIL